MKEKSHEQLVYAKRFWPHTTLTKTARKPYYASQKPGETEFQKSFINPSRVPSGNIQIPTGLKNFLPGSPISAI